MAKSAVSSSFAAAKSPDDPDPLSESGPPAVEVSVSKGEKPGPVGLWLRAGALAAIIGLSVWLWLNPQVVEGWGAWGYVGAFLSSLLSSATVIIPVPGLAVVLALGASLNPYWVGVAAGIGSALGELSGYLAGATGRTFMHSKMSEWLQQRLGTKSSAAILFVLALFPMPVFDVAGILAGAMRIPVPVFLASVAGGKIIKHVLVALMGAGLLPVFRQVLGL
jgi:membrane protein YqaA with SNARE-associated domain